MDKYFRRFKNKRILVIGDIMLDRYIWGSVSRISPEAPVPVVEVENETTTLGGAANVVHNLHTLGASPIICGMIGADIYGGQILTLLSDMQLDISGLITDSERDTTVKTRVVGNKIQVVRFDTESTKRISNQHMQRIIKFVENNLKSIDGIIISDYNKGVISPLLMHDIKEVVKDSVFILSDPHKDNFRRSSNIDLITPNTSEAGAYAGFAIKNEKELEFVGKKMLEELQCKSVLITRSEKGMALFESNGDVTYIPTIAKKVFDVSGAGDTVIGVIALGISCGMDMQTACKIANVAAGIVVGKIGTATLTIKELKKYWRKYDKL